MPVAKYTGQATMLITKKRWKNVLPWFSVTCVLRRKFDGLEIYASLRKILNTTENSELVCNELHFETIPKKDLKWTAWHWTLHKSWEQKKYAVACDRFLCANPRRGLDQQLRRPNYGLSSHNRHKLWFTGIYEGRNSLTIIALSPIQSELWQTCLLPVHAPKSWSNSLPEEITQ